MTKSETIYILKNTFLPIDRDFVLQSKPDVLKDYTEAIRIAINNLESNISYKSKWVFDSQISGGYYHHGCKAKNTLPPDDAGAVYTYFRHQYRFCPDCGEPMIVEEE